MATVLYYITEGMISTKLNINTDKVQGLAQQVQFLEAIWQGAKKSISEIKQKL